MIKQVLLISILALLGVFSRYGIQIVFHQWLHPIFPYATFLINSLGSFFIGMTYILGVERSFLSADLRIGLMVGFLGGFTTFSTYSLEGIKLLEEADYLNGILYFILSPLCGYLATFLGMVLTRRLLAV